MNTKLFKQKLLCLAFLIAANLLVTTSIFSQATFERFGSLAPSSNPFLPLSNANGVSSDGKIVTGGSNSEVNEDFTIFEAYRWENGEMLGLGYLSDETFDSRVFGISADGFTLVGSSRSDDFEGNPEAFVWNGEMVGLGALPGHITSTAKVASADGSIIIGNSYNSSYVAEAFRWENGSMTSMGFVENGTFSEAWGMVPDGSVIVGTSGNSYDDTQAVYWENGEINLLGVLPGGDNYSFANRISTDGSTIVGGSHSGSVILPGTYTEAFRWVNGEMQALGDLPGGGFFSSASVVSPDGSIVLGWGESDLGFRAFIWTEDTGMIDFQQFLEDEYDLFLEDFILDAVRDMNGDGTVFVGDGIGSTGKLEAWRITIPEPLFTSAKSFPELVELSLYPNPTTGTVNIETTETIESIKVYDVTGKQVVIPITMANNTLDISGLSNGVYFAEITINGHKQTNKIIKE